MTNKVSSGIRKFDPESARLRRVDPLKTGKILFVGGDHDLQGQRWNQEICHGGHSANEKEENSWRNRYKIITNFFMLWLSSRVNALYLEKLVHSFNIAPKN